MVIASSSTGTVSLTSGGEANESSQSYWQPTWAAMGCRTAGGREWVLLYENNGEGASSNVSEAAVAGNYAALAVRTVGGKYGYSVTSRVQLFDLRTGCELSDQLSSGVSCNPSATDRGGEAVFCGSGQLGGCPANGDARIDQLVLGPDAASAAHTTLEGLDTSGNRCSCRVEQIQDSDSTGVHTLDSVTEPDGSPTQLTNLTLTGDTLTWEHSGSPQSAQLQP
jgi:hypothetical protein